MAISNEELYNLYVNKDWSIRKINLHSGVGRPTLSKRLKEMGVQIKGNHPNQERRYSKDVDTSFFQRESDEKYYVLGFFFADGSFTENGIKFDQTQADREILDKIKDVMQAETDVKTYEGIEFKMNDKTYISNPMCRLSISRTCFKEELLEFGFSLNKTYEKSTLNIPKEYIGSFLRGFFDGDGSITIGNSSALSFTIKEKGNAIFISDLLKKVGTEPFIYHRENKDVYTVIIRKKKELIIFRESIYENANHLYLKRKKIGLTSFKNTGKPGVLTSDVDGFTSAALLYNYLRANYPESRVEYQVHDQKRHGLDMVDGIYQNKYDLIIVPDAGSNEYEKHKEIKDLNIDLLVLDHHDAEYESKDALVVNNQLSKNYKNKALSGVGIVWQLCRAMDNYSIVDSISPADNYLDLVAVGNVADMVDLRSFETRRLIDKGLGILNNPFGNTGNIFLSTIVDKQSYSLGNEVTPIGIAFYIAPMINAVVRVGTHEERVATFECFLDEIANDNLPSTKRGAKKGDTEVRVEQGVRVANNIRNRQKREEQKGTEAFGSHIDQEYLDKNSLIVLDTGGAVVKDLNGLIANQMQSKYKRPSLVVREVDGYIEGSGRGHETTVMEDFRGFIRDSGFAEFVEGHANAFGCRFTKENFDKFIEYANETLDYGNAHKEYAVDFIIENDEIDSNLILEVASLKKYWGTGVDEPYIYFKDVPVAQEDKTLMKGNTLKLMAKDIPCIQFRAPEGAFEELAPNEYTDSIVDIVGKPNLNVFNGNTTGQIFIEEYKIKETKVSF